MAIKVPTYGRQQQQLQGLDTSGADLRISGQDLTGGLGESLGQVSDQAADLYSQKLKEANEARVLEATNKLDEAQNELITGDALQRKGKNATGLTDEYLPAFEERAEKIKQELDLNEPQKEAFNQVVQKRKPRVQKTLMKHQQQEFEQYKAEQWDAYEKNKYRSAVENWDDTEQVNKDLLGLRQSIRIRAKNEGWSDEKLKASLDAAGSNIVYSVLDRQTANGQAETAAQFLEDNRDYLQGEQLVKAEEMVRDATLRTRAQNETDRLLAQDLEREEAIKQARQFDDAELRDETVRRLKNRYAEREKREKREQEEASERALEAMQGGPAAGGLQMITEEGASFDDLPPNVRQNLPPDRTETALKNLERMQARGEKATTDAGIYYSLTARAKEEPRKFADTNLVQYRDKLAKEDYEALRKRKKEIRGDYTQEPGEAPNTSSTLSFDDRVESEIRKLGIVDADSSPKDWSGDEVKRVNRYREEASRRIEEEEMAKGRKLTGTEKQNILDEMRAEKVMVENWGPDSERAAATLSSDELGQAYVPLESLSSQQRSDLETLIRSSGVEPSEDVMRRAAVGLIADDPQLTLDLIAQEAEE